MSEQSFNGRGKVLVIDPSSEYYHCYGEIWIIHSFLGTDQADYAIILDGKSVWFKPEQLQLHP
jgi:hypothetical protein